MTKSDTHTHLKKASASDTYSNDASTSDTHLQSLGSNPNTQGCQLAERGKCPHWETGQCGVATKWQETHIYTIHLRNRRRGVMSKHTHTHTHTHKRNAHSCTDLHIVLHCATLISELSFTGTHWPQLSEEVSLAQVQACTC